jgi:transcriptional regulator with XRE-family HTH domain
MTRVGGWPPTGFAGRLKAVRQKAGLTQRELAGRVGCHHLTVSRLERGEQEPAWPLVLALAEALGVSCEDFRRVAAGPAGRPEGKPAASRKGSKAPRKGRWKKGD